MDLAHRINKTKIVLLIAFILILLVLFINSTTWFRLKFADYYIRTKSYDKAISVYQKAFRKESLDFGRQILDSRYISKVNFITSQLTSTYFKSAEYHFEQANYYFRPDTLDLQFLNKTMSEYEKITKLYEDYKKTLMLNLEDINKWNKILKESKKEKIKTCFAFGQEYIKRKKWQEAKIFYTKRILKYLNPVTVLQELDKFYNTDECLELKDRIWGGNIYVVLEDFEGTPEPVFCHWARDTEPIINAHKISNEVSYIIGEHSEYFDLSYIKKGYDYWAKSVNMPLTNPDLALGVRMFIKSKELFKGCLKINISYPKQKRSGVWQSDVKENLEGGWEIRRIDNLFEKAKIIASRYNWNMSEIKINRIVIDTFGVSGQFYIDEIELYVVNKEI